MPADPAGQILDEVETGIVAPVDVFDCDEERV